MFGERHNKRHIRMKEFLNWDSDSEIIEDLLTIACDLALKNADNGGLIVRGIADISAASVKNKEQKMLSAKAAVEDAVISQQLPKNSTPSQYVVSTVRVVRELFPLGHCDVPYASHLTREYFNLFLKALLASQEDLVDSAWAQRMDFNSYMKLVIEKEGGKEPPRQGEDTTWLIEI